FGDPASIVIDQQGRAAGLLAAHEEGAVGGRHRLGDLRVGDDNGGESGIGFDNGGLAAAKLQPVSAGRGRTLGPGRSGHREREAEAGNGQETENGVHQPAPPAS
ncbi:hypothetical protein RZS08_41920, partial [Arthrospira platensis SPKY1]|nr:hypothetical protein [Arthrospira platensis SPKY1]